MARWHGAMILGALAALWLAACKPKRAGSEEPSKAAGAIDNSFNARPTVSPPALSTAIAAETLPEVSADVHSHMKAHFVHALRLRDAVLAGDLGTAKAEGHWLRSHDQGAVPSSWEAHLAPFQEAARVAERAETVEVAAAAVGQIAEGCGGCHAALHARPALGSAPIVRKAPSVKAHMAAHMAALDKLWSGLITPSDEEWKDGAALLAKLVVTQNVLRKAHVEPTGSVKMLAETLQQLSRTAATTAPADRATAFSDLLTTCVGCHTTVRHPETVAEFEEDASSR